VSVVDAWLIILLAILSQWYFYVLPAVTLRNLRFVTQCFCTFHIILSIIRIISVKSLNQLVFVMEEDCVLCEVPTEFFCLI